MWAGLRRGVGATSGGTHNSQLQELQAGVEGNGRDLEPERVESDR